MIPEFQSPIPGAGDQGICAVVRTFADKLCRSDRRTDFCGIMYGGDRIIVITEMERLLCLEL